MGKEKIIEEYKKFLDECIGGKVMPGYSAAYVSKDEIIAFTGGTFTYEENSKKVEVDAIYDVASLTKILTVMTLAMMLTDEGVINLDDRVSKYIDEFEDGHNNKNEATIRNLMTYTLKYDYAKEDKSIIYKVSAEELRARTLKLKLACNPGEEYFYSNVSAFILTQVIEKVTGKNFYNLVISEIFRKLNMNNSCFHPAEKSKHLIPPTEITDLRGEVRGEVHDEFTSQLDKGGISCGAAGLFATATDVAKFLQMAVNAGEINDKQFVSKEIVSECTKNQYENILPTLTPLGWGDTSNELISGKNKRIVVKSGFTGCFMVGNLDDGKGLVLLSNYIYPKRPADRSEFTNIKRFMIDLIS